MGQMNKSPGGDVTQLLMRWRAGDTGALEALLPLVYDELRALARRHLNHERGSHTLQRTALVHEAYLRIIDQTQVDFESRAQFFGLASSAMRHVLVDHARRRGAAKRGGNARHVDLEALLEADAGELGDGANAGAEVDFEAIDEALKRLEALDSQQGKLVELRFFGGLSIKETAEVIGISPATVKREWAAARAWLQRELTERARS
jgi:RNA polymerase sigma factor (TIGR02999 family)